MYKSQEEISKEFDKKFVNNRREDGEWFDRDTAIKSFISSIRKADLEAVEEMVIEMKGREYANWRDLPADEKNILVKIYGEKMENSYVANISLLAELQEELKNL